MGKKLMIIVIAALVVLAGTTGYITWRGRQDSLAAYLNEQVTFSTGNDSTVVLTMAEIIDLGSEKVDAVMRTSSSEPQEYEYTGILLRDLLDELDISYADNQAVIVTAVDGYASAIEIDKVLESDNVYLVYAQDGQPLGTRDEKGSGPFMIIIRNDPFSQHWCKFVVEVAVE